MKKLYIVILVILPVIAFCGKVERVFNFSSYSIQPMGQYQAITFSNTMLAGLTGEPVLPYQAISMMLAPGEKAVSIEFTGEDLTTIPGSFELYPQQYNQPLSKGPDGSFIKKESVYLANSPYPATQTGNLITSYLNGFGFALSTFTPVICNPAMKQVSYYQKVTITIRTAPDAAARAALQNRTASGSALERVFRLAQNPEMAEMYPVTEAPNSAYQILIITPQQFQTGFQPLIDFYNTRGINAELATVETISSSVAGQDLQDKMRNFIKAEYQTNGIEHVILGGDVPQVPYRGFYCYVISGAGYEDFDIPADLYFSALDGNWNTNGNNKWGEPGEEDLLPEISVGRMSFSTTQEQENMVHKSINYQTNPGSWEMNKPFLVSEFLYDPPMTWGADYLELLIDDHSDNGYFTHGIPSADNNITRLYDAPGYNWSSGQLLMAINAGEAFIHHCGHSNSDYMMRLYLWDINDENFSQVNGIINNYQLMYTHGCICGAFDQEDCIAEKATSIGNFLAGGIFNSRYGWFNQGLTEGPSAHLHREFISALYNPDPDSAITELGAAHTMSKIMTAPWIGLPGEFEPGAQRWCFYDCNVLGDPAMKVWRDNPSVGTTKKTRDFSFSVSPNPCKALLTLKLNLPRQVSGRISLTNSLGEEVYAQSFSQISDRQTLQVNVSSYLPGVYFCRISTPDANLVEKVIVAK